MFPIHMAVDPGDTTGVAVFHRSKLAYTASVVTSNIHELRTLSEIMHFTAPNIVIVEQPPQNSNSQWLYVVYQDVIRAAENIEAEVRNVTPGNWKPAMRIARKGLSLTIAHQKDAVCIGLYYLQHMK